MLLMLMMTDNDDDFWSVAMNATDERSLQAHRDESDNFNADVRWKTIKTPSPDPFEPPLVLRLCENIADGCLSDVSSNVWDASLLLAAFLYGTSEGRHLCYSACFGQDSTNAEGGGILELGSGLGLSGLAAAASALAICNHHESISRVVLSDMNNDDILSLLRKNVESNLKTIIGKKDRLDISVESCDWLHVANLKAGSSNCCPAGKFNLIIGSELVYVPDHAVACAETISHYLSQSASSQAIVIQIPERAGFDAFLSRCRELNLTY